MVMNAFATIPPPTRPRPHKERQFVALCVEPETNEWLAERARLRQCSKGEVMREILRAAPTMTALVEALQDFPV